MVNLINSDVCMYVYSKLDRFQCRHFKQQKKGNKQVEHCYALNASVYRMAVWEGGGVNGPPTTSCIDVSLGE